MRLYGVILSPFVQRVLLAARWKGHALELAPPPGGAIASPEFAAISPMCRIPVLEEADGWRIAESAAIVEYLDGALPGPALRPGAPRELARARQVTAIVDIEIGAGLRHFATQKMFGMCDIPAQLDYGREQIARGLAALEHIDIGIGAAAAWAVTDTPGIADAALAPVLAFADNLTEYFDGGPLIANAPGVAAYWARAKADPLVARTIEEMAGIVPLIMQRRAAAA